MTEGSATSHSTGSLESMVGEASHNNSPAMIHECNRVAYMGMLEKSRCRRVGNENWSDDWRCAISSSTDSLIVWQPPHNDSPDYSTMVLIPWLVLLRDCWFVSKLIARGDLYSYSIIKKLHKLYSRIISHKISSSKLIFFSVRLVDMLSHFYSILFSIHSTEPKTLDCWSILK